jgi:HEAT repeat protein
MPSTLSSHESDKLNFVHQAIAKKEYSSALTHIFALIEELIDHPDDDQFSMGFELLYSICDKSDYIIKSVLEFVVQTKLIDLPQDWVRLETIHILTKIYPHIPDFFDPIIEKIEMKLFDIDKKVRESAVNLVSLILNRTLENQQFPDLYLSLAQMLKDESWIVRVRTLEGILRILRTHTQINDTFINVFREEAVKLLQDPDEEVRTVTTETLKEICMHSGTHANVSMLRTLLKADDWEVREKGIYILGEIAGTQYNIYSELFDLLVPMFADEIMMIQTKVIDAFAKIGNTNGPALLRFFLPLMDTDDEDIRQGIIESVIYITLHNTKKILPELIPLLENNSERVRSLIGNCLLKIYMETPDRMEEEVARMFQNIDPENWRSRLRTIRILGDLCFVLRIKSIAVWTAISLKKWGENERDLDVLDEIEASLSKINNVFSNLTDDIQQVENRKKFYYEEMELFQEFPKKMRDRTEEYIKQKKFNEAEIYLEEEGNRIAQKLTDFEKKITESDFKRFSPDIFEDWNDIKEEIFEEISDVKSYEYNAILDAKSEYIEELDAVLSEMNSRIEILKIEYESLKDIGQQLNEALESGNNTLTEDIIGKISSLRDRIFKLEFDIGQVWLNNLEFKDFLKDLTISWIDTKLEIQQFIAEIIQRINAIRDTIDTGSDEAYSLKKKITFEFLSQQFQNYVMQAVQSQREVLENFKMFEEPITKELQKRHFQDARHLVELTINNLNGTIENHNREINKIYEEIDKINIPLSRANEIRKFLNNWNEIKELVHDRVREFSLNTENEILISEITEYQRIMNPIPLKQLSKSINIPHTVLTERLVDLIAAHHIRAEIRDDQLIQIDQPKEERILNFFKKVNIQGTKIQVMIRIYNPTRFFINEMSVLFSIPNTFELDRAESDLTEINIKEFEPEAFRIFQWQFKLNKPSQKQYQVERLAMEVMYKNPFGNLSKIRKEMDIIL